jgi:PiT family inorganic phosphate transporter
MEQSVLFIVCVILLAYCFDFINGFHDAGNAIATIVTTGVLTPRQAVLWAAFFNFIAFAFFHLFVAKTMGQGIVEEHIITPGLIFSALSSAISWGLITWYFGLPASSSHALIGGLAGAAIVKGGISTLKASGFIKVAIGIFISPVIGLIAGWLLTLFFRRFKTSSQMHKTFKPLQLFSSALLSLAHGGNDAQKTMGIIAILLFSTAWLEGPFYVPFWVVISCNLMMSLGTLLGGWRIIRTMGTQITTLNAMRGSAAQTGAALVILASTEMGIPVSTTQTVTGAIAGVGINNKGHQTRWPIVRIIFVSWLLTLPATGILSAIIMRLILYYYP